MQRAQWKTTYGRWRAEDRLWQRIVRRIDVIPSFATTDLRGMCSTRLSGDMLGWCAQLGPKALHKLRMYHCTGRVRLPG